jgi:hypothetical protein
VIACDRPTETEQKLADTPIDMIDMMVEVWIRRKAAIASRFA